MNAISSGKAQFAGLGEIAKRYSAGQFSFLSGGQSGLLQVLKGRNHNRFRYFLF